MRLCEMLVSVVCEVPRDITTPPERELPLDITMAESDP
jgi:hypothetical protein